ncbi:MAG: hypothetical protein GEU73_04815 [Chloroflexi bacterium]|nr:hypothetical protein [Chloroflexota bacterium]
MREFVRSATYRGYPIALAAIGVLLLGAFGCLPAEQRPAGTSSVSGPGTGTGTGTVSGVGPGVVQPKPADATQVDVRIGEWYVRPSVDRVRAGRVYFLVANEGPEDPHELVIIKSDLAPDRLPEQDGRVPESQVNLIGEIEAFAPMTSASGVFDLTSGNYVLICNIAEVEDGALESHYHEGMQVRFIVE